MLVRNAYTGALHEVPDQQLYEVGEPVYDGFGNPVGGIFDDIVNTVKNVVSAPIQAASSLISPIAGAAGSLLNPLGNIIGGLIPGLGPRPAAPPPLAPAPYGGMMPPYVTASAPQQGFPMMPHFRPPFPLGWQHSPLPYTGLGPKRLYMRCAVWPGPAGLVPGYAANMTPQQQQALMPPPPGAGGYGGRHRHRGHHRRR